MTRPDAVAVRSRRADLPRTQARGLRGVLVGLLGGAGAYAAHQLAGGHAAGTVGVIVTLLAVGIGVAMSRRQIGLVAALGLALGAQGVSHLLMTGSGSSAMMMGQPGSVDHVHHAHEMLGARASGSGLSMLLAHAAVALVTALAIRGADRAVLDVLRTLVGWFLPRTWLPVAPLARARFPHVTDARLLPHALRVVTPLSRRGPPVLTRLSPFTS